MLFRSPNTVQIDASTWLEDFVTEYSAASPEAADIEIIGTGDTPQLLFDETHLRQILTNLLDNARRHAGTETTDPEVQLQCIADAEADSALIQVIDNGPGIDSAEEAMIFEPFYTTAQQGSGLGLYISKDLAEINNGVLDYTRGADRRSCFSLRVPTA